MNLYKTAIYSEAGRKINEDLGQIYKGLAWILDGSSGLSEKKLTSGPTDASWFVERINEQLILKADETTSLQDILKPAVSQVSKDFLQFALNHKFYPYEYPSCSIALIRVTKENELEYLILGDITIAIKTKDQMTIFTDPTVSHLDKAVANQIKTLQKYNKLNFTEALQQVRPELRKNRALMNTPDGYWILGLDPTVINHALTGSVNLNHPSEVLLASDGFTRLVDTFGAFNNWNELFMSIERAGLDSAFKQLRELEVNDSDCFHYPRLKVSDDATAIYLKLDLL